MKSYLLLLNAILFLTGCSDNGYQPGYIITDSQEEKVVPQEGKR
jgi:PBP1b-binding outer membrane lipoprotein LpoB